VTRISDLKAWLGGMAPQNPSSSLSATAFGLAGVRADDLDVKLCQRTAELRHRIGDWRYKMLYKKINVELIVVADEADPVVAELNAALDRLEQKHELFGGGIETVAVEHPGLHKRSALAHTLATGERVAGAVRVARQSVTAALRAVI